MLLDCNNSLWWQSAVTLSRVMSPGPAINIAQMIIVSQPQKYVRITARGPGFT